MSELKKIKYGIDEIANTLLHKFDDEIQENLRLKNHEKLIEQLSYNQGIVDLLFDIVKYINKEIEQNG